MIVIKKNFESYNLLFIQNSKTTKYYKVLYINSFLVEIVKIGFIIIFFFFLFFRNNQFGN